MNNLFRSKDGMVLTNKIRWALPKNNQQKLNTKWVLPQSIDIHPLTKFQNISIFLVAVPMILVVTKETIVLGFFLPADEG